MAAILFFAAEPLLAQTGGKVENIVINKNTIPTPQKTMPGQAITVIGPDDDGKVDHVRITQYGFSVDPLFSCDFANGTADNPTRVQNREALCTFQARGCTLEQGCKFDGTGYGPSTVQFRILSCQDWTADGRCTRVQMSTTQHGTKAETAKVNWADGGHIEYGNFLPTLGAGCGDGAKVVGSDNGFRVTVRPGAANCEVRFHNRWLFPYGRSPYSPSCVANNETSPEMVRAASITSDGLVLAGRLANDDRINVICVGRHDLP